MFKWEIIINEKVKKKKIAKKLKKLLEKMFGDIDMLKGGSIQRKSSCANLF